jgi:ribosomal protein S18 acetylase RimI-like enzyme
MFGRPLVRAEVPEDREWKLALLRERWGSEVMVTRGRALRDLSDAPAFVAERRGKRAGLATYCIEGEECELTSLDAVQEGVGCGSALLRAVEDVARSAGCRRVCLITTNDNTKALRFYQRRGYVLAALQINEMARIRELKPGIPEIGLDGIPLRDVLELEKTL